MHLLLIILVQDEMDARCRRPRGREQYGQLRRRPGVGFADVTAPRGAARLILITPPLFNVRTLD